MKSTVEQINMQMAKLYFMLCFLYSIEITWVGIEARSYDQFCSKLASKIVYYIQYPKESSHRVDFKRGYRCVTDLLIQKLKKEGSITRDPYEADIFLYVVRQMHELHKISKLYSHTRILDPQGLKHVYGINVDDGGWGFLLEDFYENYKGLSFPSHVQNSTLVSMYGLHSGSTSTCYKKKKYKCIGYFRKNIDMVVPGPNKCTDERRLLTSMIYRRPVRPLMRETLLYFAGSVWQHKLPYSEAASVRKRFFDYCNQGTHRPPECMNVRIFGNSVEYNRDISNIKKSVFCLNPSGAYGGYSVRLPRLILHGCIPVNIVGATALPFDSLLNYSSFSLTFHVETPAFEVLNVISKISGLEIKNLRRGLSSVYKYFNWKLDASLAFGMTLQEQICTRLRLREKT